jgi:hypothetical protein
LIVGRVSGGIGGVGTPGQVDQDQDVAERIADYAGSAHRDVERCRDEDAAVLDQVSDSILDVVDEPVGLAQTRVEVRHRHADRVDPSKDPTTAHP